MRAPFTLLALALGAFQNAYAESFGYIPSDDPIKDTVPIIADSLNASTIAGIPRSVDWRGKYVTPVRDQGQCGSCWAFSATEQVESALAFATGGKDLTVLSVEQSVVCCGNSIVTCNGCMGGDPFYAYEAMIKDGGVDTDSDYPYDARFPISL